MSTKGNAGAGNEKDVCDDGGGGGGGGGAGDRKDGEKDSKVFDIILFTLLFEFSIPFFNL